MTFIQIYLTAGLVIWALMTLLWLISLWLRDSSIVDPFWGAGFVVSAWVFFWLTPEGFITRKGLVVLLVTLWGLRLSLHLLRRNWGRGEDFRYQAWRQEHGPRWWWRSYLQVYGLQGVLLWLISLPLLAAQVSATPASLTWLDWLALPIWCLGFFFEAAGDQQLARFKADPASRGRVLNTGVWRYTRHPNYFGDAAQWWAYYLLAATAGGFWTILSPLIMTFLLVRVSGVALLEKTLKEAKPGYQDYMERTSAFIPWFPRTSHPKDIK